MLRYRASNPFSTVPAVPVWFRFIADTIVNLMNQRSWVTAFRENGVGDSQMHVSDYIKRHLVSITILPVSALVPGVDILNFIFPSNRMNLPFPFFASPFLPLAIPGAGGHAPRVAGTFNMVNGHTNVRPAMPINLDQIVVRAPRPKAKAKAKAKS